MLFAGENLNSILISARFVCIINIGQVLTIIFESVSSDLLSLNQINEQLNQFIDGEGFHIHYTLMQS